jgi:hypothetical protein
VLVKLLPVEDPQRLFFVDNSGGKSGGSSGPPYPCYERMRDHNRFLSGIAAFNEGPFKVTIDGAPEQVFGQVASGSYFDVLGVNAIYGRVLTPADDSIIGRGGPDGAVAVISYGFWLRRFGRDPAVLGKTIQVGTDWVTIVGVTPPDFFGLQVGSPIDITVPMMLSSDNVRMKQSWWMSVVGRVKADASVASARDDLNGLFDAYMDEIGFPREKRDYFSGIELVPAARGLNALRRNYSEPLLIIMAIVAVVLLIGCANAANLLWRGRAHGKTRSPSGWRLAPAAPGCISPARIRSEERSTFPGQRVEDEYEIVGIVGDTRYRDLRTPDERMAYVPIEQSLDPVSRALVSIQARVDPMSLVGPLRTLAAGNLPGGFVSKIGTVEQRLQQSLVRERLLSMLATFFAGLALTLACIGLYGIMAYGVVRRTREIGIRVAIGADDRSVMWMVMRETSAWSSWAPRSGHWSRLPRGRTSGTSCSASHLMIPVPSPLRFCFCSRSRLPPGTGRRVARPGSTR